MIFAGAIRIRHRGSEESSVDAVRRQFQKGIANSFTGSPDILRSQHSVERLNAQWRDSASSQRGSARKNGGQRRNVRKGSETTPFSGLKGMKRQCVISDIHKSSRAHHQTPETNIKLQKTSTHSWLFHHHPSRAQQPYHARCHSGSTSCHPSASHILLVATILLTNPHERGLCFIRCRRTRTH
jgi:hypothetical protein